MGCGCCLIWARILLQQSPSKCVIHQNVNENYNISRTLQRTLKSVFTSPWRRCGERAHVLQRRKNLTALLRLISTLLRFAPFEDAALLAASFQPLYALPSVSTELLPLSLRQSRLLVVTLNYKIIPRKTLQYTDPKTKSSKNLRECSLLQTAGVLRPIHMKPKQNSAKHTTNWATNPVLIQGSDRSRIHQEKKSVKRNL